MLIRMEDAAPLPFETLNNTAHDFLLLMSQNGTDLQLDPVRFLNNLIDFAHAQDAPLRLTTALETQVMWAAAEVDRLRFSTPNDTIRAIYHQEAADTMVRRVGMAMGVRDVMSQRHGRDVAYTGRQSVRRAVVADYLNP